jgi:hypothetical protein
MSIVVDWKAINTSSPEQIENIRVEVIKEKRRVEEDYFKVKEQYDAKSREIITLEGQRKDLQITMSKARHLIKMLQSDEEVLRSKFWNVKRG